jgi:hypothetical protein
VNEMTPGQAAYEAWEAARWPHGPRVGWDHLAVSRAPWEAAAKAARGDLEAERDKAYGERADLVAYLAACYPSVIDDSGDDPDWPVIYVSTPSGQLSWHIAKADIGAFCHVPHTTGATWDGHTTPEKYRRLAELTTTVATGLTVHAERDKYRDVLTRLADPDTWVLDSGLGGGEQEELHVRANLARQALGLDVDCCTECMVSLGIKPEDA